MGGLQLHVSVGGEVVADVVDFGQGLFRVLHAGNDTTMLGGSQALLPEPRDSKSGGRRAGDRPIWNL